MKVRVTLPVSLTSSSGSTRVGVLSGFLYHSISFSIQEVSRASDTTSTIIEYVGVDHYRLHALCPSNSRLKLVRVVIPQTPQDEFVPQFLTIFRETDWLSHKTGDNWPAEGHGG